MEARPYPPLVITGFMGAGKTSVGKVLADRLGWDFVDMDRAIEEREGMSVSKIFETRGEAYFRGLETELCLRLARAHNLVVSTGGGSFVNPANREHFREALVVCLDADTQEIYNRIREEGHRPLLRGSDPYQRIVELMEARRGAYSQVEWHLDTNRKTIEEVAGEILGLLQPRRIQVAEPESVCPIFVGPGLLNQVGRLMDLARGDFSPRCALVTSPRLAELHAAAVMESLKTRGFEAELVLVPDQEALKTLDSARGICDSLIEAELDRRSIVFALGGGVIGDLAGFAAATYLRGLPLVQLPTTLLAMIDASIGGKVGLDHPRGRNLIGAFKLPNAVIADTEALATLPEEELLSGMAEVVKHGIIGDPELFALLEADPAAPLPHPGRRNWIVRAMQVKIDIVARDPLDRGERGKLNLGHTFGYAFEQLSGYRLQHGEAVAIGLVCAARLAEARGLCLGGTAERIEALLSRLGLPTRIPAAMGTEALLEAIGRDKKRVGKVRRFVLPRRIGEVELVDDVSAEELRRVLDATRP